MTARSDTVPTPQARSEPVPADADTPLAIDEDHYGVLVASVGELNVTISRKGGEAQRIIVSGPAVLFIEGAATIEHASSPLSIAAVIALPASIIITGRFDVVRGQLRYFRPPQTLASGVVDLVTLTADASAGWSAGQRQVAADALIAGLAAAVHLADLVSSAVPIPTQAPTLAAADALIGAHHPESAFDTAALARLMGVSARTLQRLFSAHGRTVATSIEQQRVRTALEYLSTGPGRWAKLSRVASIAGYADSRRLRAALSRNGYGVDRDVFIASQEKDESSSE